jgi:hypothetical protein
MRPTHPLKTAAVVTLTLAAIVPAAASAKPVDQGPNGASYTSPTTTVVRVIAPTNGFDWADAGIGAAGGLALSMLGIGAALVLPTHRRTRRPTRPATPTSGPRTTTEQTTPPLKPSPDPPNTPRRASRTTAVALSGLVAIAITGLVLVVTGVHATPRSTAAAHTRVAPTHTAPIHHPRTTGCRAVLDPMTGQMHGGCPPKQTHTNPATP